MSREMIERALGQEQFWGRDIEGCAVFKLDALAEQAIVVPVKVVHTTYLKNTLLSYDGPPGEMRKMAIPGIHGIPGKAIAIIVPVPSEAGSLEEEDERRVL